MWKQSGMNAWTEFCVSHIEAKIDIKSNQVQAVRSYSSGAVVEECVCDFLFTLYMRNGKLYYCCFETTLLNAEFLDDSYDK